MQLDELDEPELRARAAPGAHALLSAPGAGEGYRSAGPWARRAVAIDAAANACLEWLPQVRWRSALA